MGNGWVPIFKGFRKLLPLDRPYTKLEAAFCLQLDFDEGKEVSVTGYSTLWQWSKDKVRKFLDDIGVEIIYPESTKNKQNQRGKITSKKPTDQPTDNRLINRPIKFIDINMLKKKTDRSTDRKPTDQPDTTIDPIDPNPKKKNILSSKGSTVSEFIPFGEIISYLNTVTRKNFKATSKQARAHISARWAEGYRLGDFERVVDIKAGQWLHDPAMNKFLRPETLFSPKFDGYLNESSVNPAEDPEERAARENTERLIRQLKEGRHE